MRALVLLVWVLGVGGDAYTTISMMSAGVSEEGNPVAAAGMAVLGVVGYTIAASLVCVVLAVANIGAVTGTYARVTVAALCLLAVAKCYQALSNALLWAGLS